MFEDANASVLVPQTPLPGASVTKLEPVPTFNGKRVSGAALRVNMLEFQQKVRPAPTRPS